MSVCFFLAIITFAPVLQPVCWRRRAKENRSKRHTHVDSGAGSQVEVERLASGDSERVDDHSRALDGVVDIVQRRDGSGTVASSGRSDDDTGQDEEGGEAEGEGGMGGGTMVGAKSSSWMMSRRVFRDLWGGRWVSICICCVRVGVGV